MGKSQLLGNLMGHMLLLKLVADFDVCIGWLRNSISITIDWMDVE